MPPTLSAIFLSMNIQVFIEFFFLIVFQIQEVKESQIFLYLFQICAAHLPFFHPLSLI